MLSLYDEFAGWGGSSQGASAVPGVQLILAANHSQIAVDVHSLNFPHADHYKGDVTKADLTKFPRADLFWASPACPAFSNARGEKQYFDRATEHALFEDPYETPEQRAKRMDLVKRRAMMQEVPRYLRAMALRGRPVLGGVVENVIQVAKWDQLRSWIRAIETADPGGYTVKIISLSAMHAPGIRTARAPQSRPRFFAAYIHNSVGRLPDWDRWLRPRAWCTLCDAWVYAVQAWKKPGQEIGAYGVKGGQYVYRCPQIHGAWDWAKRRRSGLVEPEVLPALVAIDWTLPPGAKIGERVDAKGNPDPLEQATLDRIAAGLRRYAGQLLVPTTARDLTAYPASRPLRTQTARQEVGLAMPPFLASLRGGGSKEATRTLDEPLWTFSAGGQHHALVAPPGAMVMRNNTSRGDGGEMSTPVDEPLRTLTTRGHQSLITWDEVPDTALLSPYYGKGVARPVTDPVGTFTTRDRYSLVTGGPAPAVEDCTFRMLAPSEIAAGMGFAADYKVTGTNRDQVAGYGNAVVPACAEAIVSALVEAITGEDVAA